MAEKKEGVSVTHYFSNKWHHDPEDEAARCAKYNEAFRALDEISDKLRTIDKYGDDRKVNIRTLRKEFYKILNDCEIAQWVTP